MASAHVNIYKLQQLIINLESGGHKIFKKRIEDLLENHSLRSEVIHRYGNEREEAILYFMPEKLLFG